MDTKIFGGGKEKPPPFITKQITEVSVFVWEPTKPQSMRGDSNPPALLTTYYGNHSVSVSDNLLPKSLIRTLSLAFQSRTLLSFKS